MNLPEVVSADEWEAAHEKLLAKEKEATRAGDALAAERRRQPMVRIEKDYRLEGPDGEASLLDLFEGRRQLLHVRRPGRSPRPPARQGHLVRVGLASAAGKDRAVQATNGLGDSLVLLG